MRLNDLLNIAAEKIENVTQTAVVDYPIKQDMPCELIPKFNQNLWTCRKLTDGSYYVFYLGHFLNVSELKQEISNLYAQEGFLGQGFSKLDERGIMTYATTKAILKRIFNSAFKIEIDAAEVAEYLFNCENFNFTRE